MSTQRHAQTTQQDMVHLLFEMPTTRAVGESTSQPTTPEPSPDTALSPAERYELCLSRLSQGWRDETQAKTRKAL